jgi:hypothetical protein
MSADGLINFPPAIGKETVNNACIFFFHFAGFELLPEESMSAVVFGYHDEAGCVFVQAVNNTGSKGISCRGELLAVIQKPVDQGSGRVAGCGVNHEANGFVYHQKVIILINDPEGHRFGFQVPPGRRRNRYGDSVPSPYFAAGLGCAIVDQDRATTNDGLDPCPGELGQMVGEEDV